MTLRRTNPKKNWVKKIPLNTVVTKSLMRKLGGNHEIFRKVKTGTGLPANGGGFVGLADAEQLLF